MAAASAAKAEIIDECMRLSRCWKHTARFSAGRPAIHSCGAPQREAEHGIGWVKDIGRRGAEVVSAIGIVPIALYLFRWNGNVLPVFSAFREDVAVNVLDLGRVAVRLIATANGRIIGHVPF